MGIWKTVTGVFNGGKEVAEVFVENKENRGQRTHEENLADIERDVASLNQFSAEFHARENRSSWDSLVDGLNRLPRPLLTVAILSFFILAPIAPERFVLIAEAYALMPTGYWALLSVIVGFYFGGRMQLKSQDFTVKQEAMLAAKQLIEKRREFRQLDDDQESLQSKIFDTAVINQGRKVTNAVVEQWLQTREE